MREAGIQGLCRRRRRGCTVRDLHAEPYADLVDRDFVVDGPNKLWCIDITEHSTLEEKVYCAAVLDTYSRRIVGWSIDNNMRTVLVVDALGMAITRRRAVLGDSALRPRFARRTQSVVATPLLISEVFDGAASATGGSGSATGDALTEPADAGAACGAPSGG